ncbi:MAG TPA: hypothetical protein PKG60_12590 [Spirochaetota bacterium]|nr:hypothetical protein [Spirochaetota bacterium]HPS86972.1 hypothetical protein [Spirochaetota bacterium]
MLKIRESKKKQGSFFSNLLTAFKDFIDPEKEDILFNDISQGIGNKIAFQKFSNFTWPLWLSEAEDFYSLNYRSNPNPLLLNTNFREWQTFTNYLSNDEIHIDRSGMIAGPGNAPWSVEFWYSSGETIYQPQKHYSNISPIRNHKTGEISIAGIFGKTQFREKVAGGKSNIDEALVSYEINTDAAEDQLFIVIRPYNCYAIGGVNNISFDNAGNLLKINGKQSVVLERKPDSIVTGSGDAGDVNCSAGNFSGSVECSYGMASMSLGFGLKKGNNVLNLRITLDNSRSLSPQKVDFGKSFKEFRSFSELRLNEGLKMEIPDESLTKYFQQSKITLFNNNANDFNPEKIDGFRNLYFFSYAMNRAGLEQESEKLVNQMLEKFKYTVKNPDYASVISGSYLLNSFYECYIHKRESEFLQEYFPVIRKLGDYIYSFSTEIHSIGQLPGNTMKNKYIRGAAESDFIIILSAMINASYLSRCMGIFGDEVKYKNEADRIQSIVKNILEKRKAVSLDNFSEFQSLITFPDSILSGYKEDDYKEFFSSITEEKNFPLFDRLSGVDLFSSALILIHLISLKDSRFNSFYEKFFSLIDDFFTLPEFLDPVLKRGVWGDGNSKIIAALILIIVRNRIFLDRTERLEIFPSPEKQWFAPGKRIKIDDASTRYGKISFLAETSENEIKFNFTGLPKFIPSDIMINLPIETSIMESDDFILKRKVGNSYIINGWPSVIRFSILNKNESPETAS